MERAGHQHGARPLLHQRQRLRPSRASGSTAPRASAGRPVARASGAAIEVPAASRGRRRERQHAPIHRAGRAHQHLRPVLVAQDRDQRMDRRLGSSAASAATSVRTPSGLCATSKSHCPGGRAGPAMKRVGEPALHRVRVGAPGARAAPSSAASATAAFRRWCGPSRRSGPVHSCIRRHRTRRPAIAPGASALT